MRNLIPLIAALILVARFSFAGEPDHFAPKEHSPLKELIRSADLVAMTLVEVKHGVLVYRIDEVLKGEYRPQNFPSMYKGSYTLYTRAKEVPEATDKALIVVKMPGNVHTDDDELIMFVKNGAVEYPKITTPRKVLSVENYTLAQVRSLIAGLSVK